MISDADNSAGKHHARDGLRQFVLHSTLFFILQLAILAALFGVYPSEKDDYLAAYANKSSLIKAPGESRLVLVGGSNVAFGFDCDALERGTDRQIVNMGLHAGLGLHVILEQALTGVQSDDLVVVSLEYEHFDRRFGEELWPTFVEHAPGLFARMDWDDLASLLDNARHYVSGVLRRTALYAVGRHRGPQAPYSASSFDQRGCMKSGALGTSKDVSHRRYFGGKYSGLRTAWAVASLSDFQRQVEARGARLVIIPPPTLASAYLDAETGVLDIYSRLSAAGLPVLSTPTEAVMSSESFHDTEYHLNVLGQRERSLWALRLLEPYTR